MKAGAVDPGSTWGHPAPLYLVHAAPVVVREPLRRPRVQGLTLVHFSAQRKHVLLDALGACFSPSLLDRGTRGGVKYSKTAQVELRSERVEAPARVESVHQGLALVPTSAQLELFSPPCNPS
jgi:hypothetical protein